MKTFYSLMITLALAGLASAEPLIVRQAQQAVMLTGYTRSKTTMTVSSEVSGRVVRVNHDVGQTIGRKPFFEIDPTFIDFEIQNLRFAVKKMETTQKKAQSRVSYLKKEFQRIDKLYQGDSATEARRDAAEEEVAQAELELNALDADKAALEIRLKDAEERRRRHSIQASEGWIVVKKMVEPGEIVSAGTPLAVVGDYRNLTVPLSVSSEELTALRALPSDFTASLEGLPVNARINWINPEFNEATRKLAIEVLLIGYEGEGRGGLRFSLPLEIRIEGLQVPKTAVLNQYENPRVTIKETSETVHIMVLGESNGHVIIAPNNKLSPGMELTAP